jgi:hypothetical protein
VLELVIPAGCFFLLISGFAGISMMVNVIGEQQKLNTEHKVLLDKLARQCRVAN